MTHRFVVIGYGAMGSWHADHIRESGIAAVTGVYDIDPARRQAARAKGYETYDTLEAALAADADMVVIATPNDTHPALAKAALGAGRHVLMEKPAALTADELEQMYAAADAAGRQLSIHQNRRWDVDFQAVRRVLREDLVGEVFNLESRVQGSRGIPSSWRRERARGGGMVYDWGAHLIDQALLAFGGQAPQRVSCVLSHVLESSVDDGFYLELLFADNRRAFVEVNTCNFIALPRFYVAGRTGTAMIEDWRRPCRVTQCFAWSEADVAPQARGSGITKTMAPRDETTTRTFELEIPKLERFAYLKNFCAAADGEEPLEVTREQALNVLRVIDAAFESAKSGRPVILG